MKKQLNSQPSRSGRSKEIHRIGSDLCIVRLKPSLRSYTFKREKDIPGTETLRLDFFEMAATRLKACQIPCAFVERKGSDSYLSEWCDDTCFETIVKNRAVGSTLRLYPGLFPEGHIFCEPVIKFDYRIDPEDQAIAEDYVREAGFDPHHLKNLALQTNTALIEWLRPIELWDFCLVIGRDSGGQLRIMSEISPDCMRLRRLDGSSLDKDLFRMGCSDDTILAAWGQLIKELRGRP